MKPENLGLKMFTCPNLPGNLRLTANSCSTQWKKASEQKPGKGCPLFECRGCEIGAKNSGVLHPEELRKPCEIDRICLNCHKPASSLVYKRLCISCYNRVLEVVKGVNAKGTKPVKHGPVFTVRIAYLVNGKRKERVIERVSSLLEAELSIVKSYDEKVSFMRSVDGLISDQYSMFRL